MGARPEMEARIAEARALPIEAGLLGTTVRWKNGRGPDKCGPCPCGQAREDGFALNTAKNVFICRPSNARGDAIALAMHVAGVGFLEAVALLLGDQSPAPQHARNRQRIAAAPQHAPDHRWREIWEESRDPRGTLVERYLASRGLELEPSLSGEALRFHPNCPFGPGQRFPCMVALFRSISTDDPVAVHRVALAADGSKIARRMLGPVAGAAIKLDADDAVSTGLVVGEGIETCLAARQLGFQPAWALGSAGAIASFPLLPGIESLTILAEDDATNAKAVQACGERWTAAGREVIVVRPRVGSDVNDALRGAA
jgi:hypothetical protein